MADDSKSSGGGLVADAFKSFPVTTTIFFLIAIYMVWRMTGGIERGEERHAEGKDSIMLEVRGVPSAYGEKAIFTTVEAERARRALDEEEDN